MEGVVLDPEVLGSFAAVYGTLVVLALVVAGIIFGYMADEERSGRRIYWAEWPIPEAGGTSPAGEPSRKPEERKAA